MPDGSSGRPRRGRKYAQVIAGAREVFLASGFEGASVDHIARTASVSKATLYSYFQDKRYLFLEVAIAECKNQTEMAIAEIDTARPVRDVLRDIASRMVAYLTSEFGQRVFRMCVAESDRFPALGREFYETGPARVRFHLVDYFRQAAGRGDLAIEDFDLAADQFHELCKADLFPKLVFNLQKSFAPAECARVIDGAVETFLARYGAR